MKTFKRVGLHCLQFLLLVLITATASAQLRADFSATPLTGCPPMVVDFKDISAGNPTAWKWDLGNGTIAYNQNPVGTYFNPGTYTVKLVITNAGGSDSITKTKIIVVNALPIPNFTASDSTGCFPLKIQFKDSSAAGSGTLVSWQWDFGDGTLSTLQNPSHTYTRAGSFNITLRVVNSNGCSQLLNKASFIKMQNGVIADFSYTSQTNCYTPASISFNNLSTGTGALNYTWDFGDGKSSNQQNPANSYATTGTYSVKLIATSSFGCSDTVIKSNAVNIVSVKANFTTPNIICQGAPFLLTNTSTPSSVSSFWDFGDGTTSGLNLPSKVYAASGNYSVKLVNDFGSCKDSITKSIQVLSKPTSAFSAANNLSCQGPLTVSFTNTSSGAASYIWDFGDNTSSTVQNPTHTYTANGSYTVSLISINASGCSDTLVKASLVQIVPPKIVNIDQLQGGGCLPFIVNPIATIQSNNPITSYFWNFGDGSTSASATPSHTYTKSGVYDVTLVITTAAGCKDSLTISNAIRVGSKPSAQFVADPLDICAKIPVQFTDLSTGSIDQWEWTFGDGSMGIEQNPLHGYKDTGYFKVTLVVSNFGCTDTLIKLRYIHVRPPIARFDTAFTCSDRATRTFIDQSKDAQTWSWDFGDGNTSTLQNPTHTYAASGKYKVFLTVTNSTCDHTTSKNVLVIKENATLTSSPTENCLNSRVYFDISDYDPSYVQNYAWYFEGLAGSVIVTQNEPVAINFNTTGTRYSAVVITDILSCMDTLYLATPLKIFGVKANFTSPLPATCFGNTISFIDSSSTDSTHPISEYKWDFGEGNPQVFPSGPFTHNYADTGTFNVKLVIKDTYGCTDSIFKPAFVNITKPVAGFTASDTALCPSSSVTFTNTSQGVGLTYNWNFGDGNTSTAISPVYTYNKEGAFRVSLVVVDKNGCIDSSAIMVKSFTPKADYLLSDSFSTCPPLVIDFTNKSTNYADLTWDFGDGGFSKLADPSHIYTIPGIWFVKLTVTGNGGCADSSIHKIDLKGPSGVFQYNPLIACNPVVVDFTATTKNTLNYIWDYSDGNTIYTSVPASSHKFITAGNYIPKLILEDASGCKVAIVGIDTIKVKEVETNITSQTRVLCDSGIVVFKDSTITNDVISGYSWNFGDGATSLQSNPTHNYADTGFYTITLIAKTVTGCTDTAIAQKYIKIVRSPDIRILGDTSACEPAIFTFQGGFVKADTSAVAWAWNFGNGQASNAQQPASQSYPAAGTYSVTLAAVNSTGCTDSDTRTIYVRPLPVVDAGIDTTICRFANYTLNATGAVTYTWSPAGTLSCTGCTSPVAKPDSLTTYYVTGQTAFGCSGIDSVRINVKQPFKITVTKNDTICAGESISLKASGTQFYQWSPASWLDNTNINNPVAKPDSSVTYQVIGSDDRNCFKDTGYVQIKVYPIPTIQISNGRAISLSNGGSVKLVTKSSADVTRWLWTPARWLDCSTCASPLSTPKENLVYTVQAYNDGNCMAKDDITITTICNNSNVYVPNTFSPNGDGMNDAFYPRGTGIYTVKSFKVFTRWGQLLFQKNNFDANAASYGWDGTSDGKKMMPDVYVYLMEVICENNVVFPLKGNITLIQ